MLVSAAFSCSARSLRRPNDSSNEDVGGGRTEGFTASRRPAPPGEGAAVGMRVSGGKPAAGRSHFHKQLISLSVGAVASINTGRGWR